MKDMNTSPWLTFSVFVSSTFSDMQAERDYLKHIILPKVNEELKKHRIRMELVDLRWGVDTTNIDHEHERETKILKVCLNEIERCRPFFIGLLGDRYGWIPPEDRIQRVIKNKNINRDDQKRSVTALEIEFGVLSNHNQLMRSVFYIREPLPYNKFRPKIAAMYSDKYNTELSEEERKKRQRYLQDLKKSIREFYQKNNLSDKVKTYKPKWDSETEKVIGLQKWGEMVYTDIIEECKKHFRKSWNNLPQDWLEQEIYLLDEFIDSKLQNFTGRRELLSELKSNLFTNDNDTNGLILTGQSGIGKSSVFSKLFRELQNENYFVLAHSAGISNKSQSFLNVIRIWSRELSDLLELKKNPIEEIFEDKYNNKKTEKSKLSQVFKFKEKLEKNYIHENLIDKIISKFHSLLYKASDKQSLVILIDSLDSFEQTDRTQYLSWLPRTLPDNIHIFVTTVSGYEDKVLEYHNHFTTMEISELKLNEAEMLLESQFSQKNKQLPKKVKNAILKKQNKDGILACCNPLWLTLVVNILLLLDQDDFEKIMNKEERSDMAIENFIYEMVMGFPTNPGELFMKFINRASTIFDEKFIKCVLNLIACSRNGLRESDLKKLVEKDINISWDSLRFAELRRWFKPYLKLQGTNNQWNLTHSIFRAKILEKLQNAKNIHNLIGLYLSQLQKDDPLKITETMYHLIKANNISHAMSYYTDEISENEVQGATKILKKYILKNKKGIEWVNKLIMEAINNDRFLTLSSNFIYQLDEELKIDGNLEYRKKLLKKLDLKYDLKNDDNWLLNKCFLYEKIGRINQQMGEYEIALEYFKKQYELSGKLHKKNSDKILYIQVRSSSYHYLGGVYKSLGKLDNALKYFIRGMKFDKKNYSNCKSDHDIKLGLARAYQNIGLLYKSMGKFNKSIKYVKKDLKISKELYQENSNKLIEADLAKSYGIMADLSMEMGNISVAEEYITETIDIYEHLIQQSPNNEDIKNLLSTSYQRLGEINKIKGDLKLSEKYFSKDLRLSKDLYQNSPDNEFFANGLSISYSKIGEIKMYMKDYCGALNYFKKNLQFVKNLYKKNSENNILKRDICISYQNMGEINKISGNLDSSLLNLKKMNDLCKKFIEDDPGNNIFKYALAISYEKLGDINNILGMKMQSFEYYTKENNYFKELFKENQTNVDYASGYAIAKYKLATINHELGNLENAKDNYIWSARTFKELYKKTNIPKYNEFYLKIDQILENFFDI